MACSSSCSSEDFSGNEYNVDSTDSTGDDEPVAHKEAGVTWTGVSWLMMSDIVGTSVLAFPGVARNLGSVPCALLIMGLFPVSLYVAIVMSRTRGIIAKECPSASLRTMGEVAAYLFGSPRAGQVVSLIVYGFTLLGQASYLLTLGMAFQEFSVGMGAEICIYTAVGVGCVALVVPVCVIRRLGESVGICFINLLLILGVIVIGLAEVGDKSDPECVEAPAFSPDLSLAATMGAATNVVYSFAGHWMYFEVMDTMAAPKDFPKALALTGPIMVSMYLAVALVAYYFGVRADDLLAGMPRGRALRAAAFLLFAHVLIVYLIKSIVLQQYFHRITSPSDASRRTVKSYAKHGFWGTAMLCFCFVVANAIPFFSQMLGLIGGLLAGPVNFLFPLFLYLIATGRTRRWVQTDSSDDANVDSCVSVVMRACRGLGWPESLAIVLIFIFIAMTMFIGVSDVVEQLVRLNNEFGSPFSCHALPERDVAAEASAGCRVTASGR